MTVDIGSTGDTDAIVDGANVMATPVDGQASQIPDGIAPHKSFTTATQLMLTIASNSALNSMTSGDCTVRVFFQER